MIERQELINLINDLNDLDSTIPLLLVAPTSEEKSFASKINSQLKEKAITIESQFSALPSVLINCDLLITPDTAIKHMADILDVPTIELSMGTSPFLKQGSTNKESIILTPKLKDRDFSFAQNVHTEKQVRNNEIIKAQDIIYALEKYFLGVSNSTLNNKDISIYQAKKDELGTFYKNVEGRIDSEVEIERFISRDFLNRKIERKPISSHGIIENDLNFSSNWIEQIQNELIISSKHTLAAIKAALSKDTASLNQKLEDINTYIANATDYCVLPFLFYRAKIENSQNLDSEDVEKILISLKNDLQIQFDQIKEFSTIIRSNRSRIRSESTKELINESRQ